MTELREKLFEDLKYLGTDIDLTDTITSNHCLKYTVEEYKKEIQDAEDDIQNNSKINK